MSASGSASKIDAISPQNFGPDDNPELVQIHILIGPEKWGYWQWSLGAYDPVEHQWSVHALRQEMPGIICRWYNDFEVRPEGGEFPDWAVAARPVTKLYKDDTEWLWTTVRKAKEYVMDHKYNSELYVKMAIEMLKQDDEISLRRQINIDMALEKYSGVINKPPNPEDDSDYGIRTPPGY